MHGPETVDDLIYQILADKSQVVSDALDGKISEYHIKKAGMDECLEEVKELKSKGVLNPVLPKRPPTKQKIEDFFNKQKQLNNFVKKHKPTTASKSKEEAISDSSDCSAYSEELYDPDKPSKLEDI
jgi:actin-related protein